jgi:hypothetical protein
MPAIWSKEREVQRARSFSSRHHCKVNVERVIKGRGKGRYYAAEEGCSSLWWHDSVVEIVAVYENGYKVT